MTMPEHSETSRREFLQNVGATLGAGGLVGLPSSSFGQQGIRQPGIPPHRPINLPGLHAYAQKSVSAGETIQFRVSSTVPCQLSVCRLGPDVDDRTSDQVLRSFEKSPATPHPIYPGSYVHVENGISKEVELKAGSIECWIRPWKLDRFQGVITQYDYPNSCGFALFLSSEGEIALYLGDGGKFNQEGVFTGPQLQARKWHHVIAAWDSRKAAIWVDGERAGEWPHDKIVKPGIAPLRLAASAEGGVASHFLDGDLALPVIYNRVLDEHEIRNRYQGKGLELPPRESVHACWPLDEERGALITDVSPHRRHGTIINGATWMIGGPAFDGDAVPRYDDYDPTADPLRGHGLRFASDDLFDCRWPVTHKFRIPDDAKPGIYVGRIDFDLDDKPTEYYVTFIVRKPPSQPKAPILVVCSTNTWLAYNGTPFATNGPSRAMWNPGGQDNSHPEAPAYCFYRNHLAGQPTYQLGVKLPWPAAGPDVLFSDPDVGYSHLMRGERFAHVWLDRAGYDYDVITDFDLHSNPGVLAQYKTVLINGHSEYWSVEAYQGIDRYLRNGGSAIVLSGNTMFWRASFSDDGGVMECRKYDTRIGGRKYATIGEVFHSHDAKRGSLMRECGFPAWRNIGLECDGWAGNGNDDIGVYHVVDPTHFLFNQPHSIGLEKGETFGFAPDGGFPKAVGHEWDVRLTTLKRMTRTIPPGAVFPQEPEGIVTLAKGVRRGTGYFGYFTNTSSAVDDVCAEMIYWERPQGGRVFHAGAIAAGWALHGDPRMQLLIQNVFHHFGVSPSKPAGPRSK